MNELCGAKTRAGGTCVNPPMTGATRCRMHGGASPRSKAKAKQRIAEAGARRAVELFGARRDIEPGPALLELVQWTAGEVDYWRQEVRALDEIDVVWGVTRVKDGGDDYGTTAEAKPAIAYLMLTSSSDRLARYCVEALKAGIAERAIKLSEQQGVAAAGVLRVVLVAMLAVVVDTLSALGVSDAGVVDALRVAWADAMSVIVPREFRRLTEGEQ